MESSRSSVQLPKSDLPSPAPLPPRFYHRVEQSRARVLMLDYDGTLAPFRIERNQAVPYPGVGEALQHLIQAGHTHVVIASGRMLADLIPLLTIDPLPELWGGHGWERRHSDGRMEHWPRPSSANDALAAARSWIEREGLLERCELKPASLALHWRGMPNEEVRQLARNVSDAWTPIAAQYGLNLLRFNGGMELRAAGRTKADAVRTLVEEAPEQALHVYLGDDLTDEDAFAALPQRGAGILVSDVPRPTRAQYWLHPPEDLLNFLIAWDAAGDSAHAG